MELLFPLLLVALLVPMYLGVRRQKREAKTVTDMQENLKVGDQVITTSGLYGTVVDIDDDSVDLEVAEDIVTTWLRQAVREVRTQDTASDETATDTDTSSDVADADAEPAAIAEPAAVEESADQTEIRLTKD